MHTTQPTIDFVSTIGRELFKREKTYPRIIEKMKKNGDSERRIQNEITRQKIQYDRLKGIQQCLSDQIDTLDPETASYYLFELRREMKMRHKCYPRMVFFNRITAEKAVEEMSIWAALIEYFEKKYI